MLFSELMNKLLYYDVVVSVKSIIAIIITYFLSLLLALDSTKFNIESFKFQYSECMTIIAVVSLVAYFVNIIAPSVKYYFPALISSKNNIGRFLLFSTVSDFSSGGMQRNQGIFWEPGAYQLFLNLAVLFELSNSSRKLKSARIILFLVSILTTFSSTGIIVAVLMIILWRARVKGVFSYRKAFLLLAFVIIIGYIVLPQLSGYWRYTLVVKMKNFLSYRSGSDMLFGSERAASIIYPIRYWLRNPLFGIGTVGYERMKNDIVGFVSACTPVNFLVKYGLIYAIIMYNGLRLFFKKMFPNKYEFLYVSIILILMTSTESVQNHVLVLYMCWRGYIETNG